MRATQAEATNRLLMPIMVTVRPAKRLVATSPIEQVKLYEERKVVEVYYTRIFNRNVCNDEWLYRTRTNPNRCRSLPIDL